MISRWPLKKAPPWCASARHYLKACPDPQNDSGYRNWKGGAGISVEYAAFRLGAIDFFADLSCRPNIGFKVCDVPGLSPTPVFFTREQTRPRVEKLVEIGASACQGAEEMNRGRCQAIEERVPNLRLLPGKVSRGRDIFAGADAISRQGERGAGKDNDGQLAAQALVHAGEQIANM